MFACVGSFLTVFLLVGLTLDTSYAPLRGSSLIQSLSPAQATCQQNIYQYFICRTAVECAQQLVLSVRKNDQMNPDSHDYFEVLEKNVKEDSDNTMSPNDFCDLMEEKILADLKRKHELEDKEIYEKKIINEIAKGDGMEGVEEDEKDKSKAPILYHSTCDEELNEFGDKFADDAVKHAIANRSIDDFVNCEFAMAYMRHIAETVLVSDNLDPVSHCKAQNPESQNKAEEDSVMLDAVKANKMYR